MKRFVSIACAGAAFAAVLACRDLSPNHVKDSEHRISGNGNGVPVKLARVRKGTISYVVRTTAEVLPLREVDVVAGAEGILAGLVFQVGQRVNAGQVVARLDTRQAQLRLEESEAAFRAAKAVLGEKQGQLLEVEEQVERARRLKESEFISRQDLEQAESHAQTARAQADLAAAQLAQREASLAQAQYQLQRTEVTAPISGVVTKWLVSPGAHVSPGRPVVAIGMVDSVRLLVEVPRDAAPLKTGTTVTGRVEDGPERGFAGRIVGSVPSRDSDAKALSLEIQVPNRREFFNPGVPVAIALVLGERRDSLLVPYDAILEERGGQYLYTAEQGRVRRLAVKAGWVQDSMREVLEGVSAGKWVVVSGLDQLKDGSRVRVLPDNGETAER